MKSFDFFPCVSIMAEADARENDRSDIDVDDMKTSISIWVSIEGKTGKRDQWMYVSLVEQ